MVRRADESDLSRRLDAIRVPPTPDPAEIGKIVEGVVTTLTGDLTLQDFRLYRELETLADFIQTAKREIAAIRPAEIRHRDIPMATDELDAVVNATAAATGEILGAAESIEQLAATLPAKKKAAAAEAVTRIYEACNFQDITGQRITKVVKALRKIEAKVDAMLAAFGEDVVQAEWVECAPEAAAEDSLLNGPALPQAANSQDDIDAILASFD
jgi:chemotaxis protein CheZ